MKHVIQQDEVWCDERRWREAAESRVSSCLPFTGLQVPLSLLPNMRFFVFVFFLFEKR